MITENVDKRDVMLINELLQLNNGGEDDYAVRIC